MRLSSFLQQLRDAGIIIRLNGGKLVCDAPREALTAEILSSLKLRKEEIIAFLQLASSAACHPFFFGPPERRLFAFHHLPEKKTSPKKAVLLCNTLGQEYLRTHWALRQLANALVKNGHHVMRFDYFGTGDSDGTNNDCTVEGMHEDISLAAQELMSQSEMKSVTLVGVRLGATLLARGTYPDIIIDKLVLWDPIVDGGKFVAIQDLFIENVLSLPHFSPEKRTMSTPEALEQLSSFFFSMDCYQQIKKTNLLEQLSSTAERVLIVSTHNKSIQKKLVVALSAKNIKSECRLVDDKCDWEDFDQLPHLMFPNNTIKVIADELA